MFFMGKEVQKMSNFFNADNKLWSGINSAIDAILLNMLWLITCIPIITIGAATTAYYYTNHKVIRNQRSGIWTEYWSSFKGNFKQATKTWLIFLVIFVLMYFDINICSRYLQAGQKIGAMMYLFYGLLAIMLVWFAFVFAYMARFENTMKETLKNAAAIAATNPLSSLLVLVIFAAALFASWLIPLLIWFIPALAITLLNLVIEKVFRKYMTPEDLEAEQENDQMRR